MREAILTFFNKKYWHILDISVWNFNETLTNDVFSFEQLLLLPWLTETCDTLLHPNKDKARQDQGPVVQRMMRHR